MMAAEAGLGGGRETALTEVFRQAAQPLLIPYMVGGYPDREGCLEILRTYVRAGAGLVELGIPFSDPLADGPVIQAASQVALRQGIRPLDVLELAGQVSAEGAPVVLLSYLNTVLAFGPERFFSRCHDGGVLGVVIPDLPAEEAKELQDLAHNHGVDVVLLAAPTSTDVRLARIAQAASGFIYCVSTTGVTGPRAALRADLPAFLGRLRRYTHLPLAVGFGVSTPEQAAAVAQHVEGVIIGSVLVDMVTKSPNLTAALERVERFLRESQQSMRAAAVDKPLEET